MQMCRGVVGCSGGCRDGKGVSPHSHDLEGAVGRVEELDLADAALGDGVQRGTAPAALHQTDGLG